MKKMFSKQHFEKFASLIKNSEATSKQEFILEVVKLFQADNAKFKTQKFFIKSGLKKGVELNNGLNEPKKVNNRISESIYLKVILLHEKSNFAFNSLGYLLADLAAR